MKGRREFFNLPFIALNFDGYTFCVIIDKTRKPKAAGNAVDGRAEIDTLNSSGYIYLLSFDRFKLSKLSNSSKGRLYANTWAGSNRYARKCFFDKKEKFTNTKALQSLFPKGGI